MKIARLSKPGRAAMSIMLILSGLVVFSLISNAVAPGLFLALLITFGWMFYGG
jgi:hypothetical protein